jgi:hypothetical protein
MSTKTALAAKKTAPKKPQAMARPVKPAPTSRERLERIGIEEICRYVAENNSLRSWALKNGFVQQAVINWIEADKDRSALYARARDERADLVFESLDDVSNEAVSADTAVQVAGLRLKADNIKWKLARMSPKKYGDKIETVHSGQIGIAQILASIDGTSTGLPR